MLVPGDSPSASYQPVTNKYPLQRIEHSLSVNPNKHVKINELGSYL